MSGTYPAVLSVREETVDFLAELVGRRACGTRDQSRSLSAYDQAVLVLRWFCAGTRMRPVAGDDAISISATYEYLHEGIEVLTARAPNLHGALLAAKAAGYSHVTIDGTLIETDRVSTPGPTPGWICGGRPSAPITAATSRLSPCRTVGRSGPPRTSQTGARHHPHNMIKTVTPGWHFLVAIRSVTMVTENYHPHSVDNPPWVAILSVGSGSLEVWDIKGSIPRTRGRILPRVR
jgi:hypothetical protein